MNVAKRFVRQNFTPRFPWLNHAGNVKQRAMKLLLKLTAFIEVATGLGSIAVPAFVVQLLLGSELLGAGIPRGRLAGVALLALGIACWLASSDTRNCAARRIVTAMALYDISLWPAVILHAAMAVWCVARLRHNSQAS